MAEPSGHTLFLETLRAFNRAIQANRDVPRIRRLLERSKELEGIDLGVAVYEEPSPVPVDHYTVRIHDGRFESTSHGTRPSVTDWAVSVDTLRRVAEDPQACIDDPDRLDLGWLERRLGLGG